MKRIIFYIAVTLVFTCQENNKKEKKDEKTTVKEKQFQLIRNYTPIDMESWTKVGVEMANEENIEYSDVVYSLNRNSTTKPAYLSSGLVSIKYAAEYKVSVVVKKGVNGETFGLRISGDYPDRADAMFDLEKGVVIDYEASRDFESPMATIENLGNGWFKCVLSTVALADNIRIIMGATSGDKKVTSWEGNTETLNDIYFVPSSITLEEKS